MPVSVDTPPRDIAVHVSCGGVQTSWTAPIALQDYDIEGYNVLITELNSNFTCSDSTNDTEIEISFDSCEFVALRSYTIEVSAIVCGGAGKPSIVEWVAATGQLHISHKLSLCLDIKLV